MTEAPSTTDDPQPGQAATPPGRPADPGTTKLTRLLTILAIATVALVVVFGVVYYLGQRNEAGPSLAERTVTVAEDALRENPNDIGARLILAAAYNDADRPDEALTQYQEIIRVEPGNRSALLGAAAILYKNDDLGGAKAYYEQVVEQSGGEEFSTADPQLQEAFYYLGVLSLGLNDPAGAVANLESALSIDKTDADAWFILGNAQYRNGKYKEAAAAYQQALAFVPTGWCEPYNGLELAYGKLRNADGVTFAQAMNQVCSGEGEAGTERLAGLTSGEFQLPALLGLGLASETTGRTAEAIDWYRKAVELDPTNVPALTALARLGGADGSTPASASPDTSASAS